MIDELSILLVAITSGVLYRLGGIGKPWNTKFRDLGIPLVICSVIGIYGGFSWLLIPLFILSFGSMTTYWKKGSDCEFAHWVTTSFFYTIPYVCYFYLVGNPSKEVLHCVVGSTLCSSIWSEAVDTDWLEEFGRGFILAWFVLHIM